MKRFGAGDTNGKRRNSLRKRWLKTYFAVLLVLGILFLIGYGLSLKYSYYSIIEDNMMGRLTQFTSFYNDYADANIQMSDAFANRIVNDFRDGDIMKIDVLDENGRIVASSNYLHKGETIKVEGQYVSSALNGYDDSYVHRDPDSGEKLMSGSSPLLYMNEVIGAVRYVTSLEVVDKVIVQKLLFAFVMVGFFLSALFSIIWLFTGRVISDLKEMDRVTREIANLKFDEKLKVAREDEIGDLAQTINYMSETLENSLNLKDEFIASVTHDLRTPLSIIHGWAELSLDEENQDEALKREAFQSIHKESERLKVLVEDLLDFSKLNAGKMILNKSLYNVNNLVAEVYELFRPKVERYNIVFSTELGDIRDVGMDYNRIKQVLVNLIDNSIKYGDVDNTITIRTYAQDEKVVVSVKDTGIGISEEDLQLVTQKFTSLDHSKGGSGLGLAIAREIVERHGGALSIKSKLGIGTEVFIIFS